MEIIKTNRKINQKAINELILLLNLFLKTNASDKELSEQTGISSSTVGRRLVDKELMAAAFPFKSDEEIEEMYNKIKELRQKNLANAKILGCQNSVLNNSYFKDENGKFVGSGKISLKIFSENKDYQNRILWHIAHTFGLHPDTLGNLFGIDPLKIRIILIDTRKEFRKAHDFLCNYDVTDQSMAQSKFLAFYYQFLTAVKTKNTERKRELLNYLTDTEFINLKKTRSNLDITEIKANDIEIMLRYHLKYALTYKLVSSYYKMSIWVYKGMVEKYLKEESNAELKRRFEALTSYNMENRSDLNNEPRRF